MDLADLIRLYGGAVLEHGHPPKRIRVTEFAVRGSCVDVPCPEGGRELRVHPADWHQLVLNLRQEPVEDAQAVYGLRIVYDPGLHPGLHH